jgi:hypothetical protein
MWLFHIVQQKRVFIYSSYTIFMFLAILSLWRTIEGYSLSEISALFAPVFYAIIFVLCLLLLVKPAYFVLLYLITMSSILLMTTILVEVNGWTWTDELIVAYTLLTAVSGVIILFIFTQQEEMIHATGVSILYSISLFILLLVGELFTPLLSQLMLILIVGQAIAYVISILFLPWVWLVQKDQKKRSPVSIAKRERTREESVGYHQASAIVLIGMYIGLVMFSWYYVQQTMIHLSWTLVWMFSLFLLAAFYNSFKSSLIIHSVLLFIGVTIAGILYIAPAEAEWEVIMGALLLIGAGTHQLVIWMLTAYKSRSTYLIAFFCFVAALIPLSFSFVALENFRWVTFTLLFGFLILSGLSVLYLPFLKQVFFLEKRRSNRPFHDLNSDSTPAPSPRIKEQVENSYISIGVRERDLILQYGKWLRKKETNLQENFSKNDD